MPVRQATEVDRERWLEMRAALWPELTLDEHDAAIGRCLDAPLRHAAFLHERAAGTIPGGLLEISRSLDTPGVARVQALYVAPHARRQGVARSLLEAADAWASRAGCREMQLAWRATSDTDDSALTAMGFRETSRVVNYQRRVHAAMAMQPAAAAATPPRAASTTRPATIHAVEPRDRRWLHALLISAGIASLFMTDIYSGDLLRGGLLPLLDLVFIIYLIALLIGRQYRRRTDARERTARLFDTGPPADRNRRVE